MHINFQSRYICFVIIIRQTTSRKQTARINDVCRSGKRIRVNSARGEARVRRLVNSPWIVEFNESERRAPTVFQVDESNFTELVEEILNVLRTNVRRQIADVYSALVSAAVRHDTYCFPTRGSGDVSAEMYATRAEIKQKEKRRHRWTNDGAIGVRFGAIEGLSVIGIKRD